MQYTTRAVKCDNCPKHVEAEFAAGWMHVIYKDKLQTPEDFCDTCWPSVQAAGTNALGYEFDSATSLTPAAGTGSPSDGSAEGEPLI